MARLQEAGAAGVLAEVARVAAEDGAGPEGAAAGEYLQLRAEQMAYPAFRAAGWPIGSGMIESGNKLVVEARLKGAGMGWGAGALNPMLARRNAGCNDRWGEAWETIWAGQGAAWRAGRAGAAEPAEPAEGAAGPAESEVDPAIVAEVEAILERVAAEMAAERAERGVVGGKPGPGHHWRRQPLGRPQ